MVNPSQLSKRQLGILLAVWDTGHEAQSKWRQPFKADEAGIICELSNQDKVTLDDEDFRCLVNDRYIEPIDDKTYILTEEADDAYLELVALYRDRLVDADVSRSVKNNDDGKSGGQPDES